MDYSGTRQIRIFPLPRQELESLQEELTKVNKDLQLKTQECQQLLSQPLIQTGHYLQRLRNQLTFLKQQQREIRDILNLHNFHDYIDHCQKKEKKNSMPKLAQQYLTEIFNKEKRAKLQKLNQIKREKADRLFDLQQTKKKSQKPIIQVDQETLHQAKQKIEKQKEMKYYLDQALAIKKQMKKKQREEDEKFDKMMAQDAVTHKDTIYRESQKEKIKKKQYNKTLQDQIRQKQLLKMQ